MRLHIYLMRHGQTEFNRQGLVQGWADSPLTEEGKAGIVQSAQYFAQHYALRFDAAFCSTLARTQATAQLFLDTLQQGDLPILALDELREYRFGGFERQSSLQLQQRLAQENGFDNVDDWLYAYRHGKTHRLAETVSRIDPAQQAENEQDFIARLQRGMDAVIDASSDNAHVLVVSHGMAITALLKCIDPESTAYRSVPNASLSRISYDSAAGWRIHSIGE